MTTASIATRPPADRLRSGRARWLGMVVISLGVSLIVVDATIVNVLLPRMVAGLGLRSTDAEWITSVYSLMFAALLIPFGRAGDLFGRRRMFVAGTVVFVLASLLVATAGSATGLLGGRALQGVGASMIMPATLSTVNTVFTGRDRAVAFGIWGSLIGGMAALGPLLGGWLATSFGWRWAFAVNLPLGLILVIGAVRLVPETRAESADRRVDWLGGGLAVLGLGALVCGLIEGQEYGWWAPTRPFTVAGRDWPLGGLSPVPVVLALGIATIAAMAAVEHSRARAGRPVMLDLALLRISNFRGGATVSALVNVGELGLLFVLPLFLQNVHDDSPLQISVAILPLALGAFAAGPVAARLSHARGAERVVRLGMLFEVCAVLTIGLTVRPGTTGFGLAPWMLLYGVGIGFTHAQLTNLTLADVPPAQAGQASGAQSTARQIGAALGIAIIGTVFTTSLSHAMLDQLKHTSVPQSRHAALAEELRVSAGTSAGRLGQQGGQRSAETRHSAADTRTTATSRSTAERRAAESQAKAEDQAAAKSLAAATRNAALAGSAILGLGLLMALRLGRSTAPHRAESSA